MFVSAVMPTRGRREWARLALECFLTQDYPYKELIILDDIDDPSFESIPTHPMVRYYCETRRNVVEKRNRVNELATGPLIAHFDSDDHSFPSRISTQVAFMKSKDKAVVGFCTLLFYEVQTQKVARYIAPPDYACGTSLLYTKSFWEKNTFKRPKLTVVGSDNIFVRSARDAKELAAADAGNLMVARAHDGNISPKKMYQMNQQLTLQDLPAGFPR
jgi:glycosyltransferase involved in cell wall biosynthesis